MAEAGSSQASSSQTSSSQASSSQDRAPQACLQPKWPEWAVEHDYVPTKVDDVVGQDFRVETNLTVVRGQTDIPLGFDDRLPVQKNPVDKFAKVIIPPGWKRCYLVHPLPALDHTIPNKPRLGAKCNVLLKVHLNVLAARAYTYHFAPLACDITSTPGMVRITQRLLPSEIVPDFVLLLYLPQTEELEENPPHTFAGFPVVIRADWRKMITEERQHKENAPIPPLPPTTLIRDRALVRSSSYFVNEDVPVARLDVPTSMISFCTVRLSSSTHEIKGIMSVELGHRHFSMRDFIYDTRSDQYILDVSGGKTRQTSLGGIHVHFGKRIDKEKGERVEMEEGPEEDANLCMYTAEICMYSFVCNSH